MVDSSTDIDKSNYYLLNQIIEHKDKTMMMTYGEGKSGPCTGQTQKCGRVKNKLPCKFNC